MALRRTHASPRTNEAHCRDADDLPPLVAILILELERGQPLVTRAMCGIHGLETAPVNSSEAPLIGAFVQVAAAESALSSEVAAAMADGVITGTEQNVIEEKAAALDRKTEALRSAVAAAGGRPLKVVG